MTSTGRWTPTTSHARAVLAAATLTVIAVLGRRPDLLVLVAPFAAIATWGGIRRPLVEPRITCSLGTKLLHEGDTTAWRVEIDDAEGRIGAVACVLPASEFVDAEPPSGQIACSLADADDERRLAILLRPVRWGQHRVGPGLVVASSAWGAFRLVARDDRTRSVTAVPRPERFDAATPPLQLPGLVGANRSPQQGAGVEFAAIREFRPGDRLRQIHWARSLRAREIHIATSWADHDRHVVVIIDAFDDVGDSDGVDGRASSLDIAVRAGTAVAEHYLRQGDRVELVGLGSRHPCRVAPAAGSRQLRRITDAITTIEPAPKRPTGARMPVGIGTGALVIMLSPMLSPTGLQRAVELTRRGVTVVAVDCLPATIMTQPAHPELELAWRLRRLQRDQQIRRAIGLGVPVVPWRGPGSLDAVVRNRSRHGRVAV